jgi:hypothetical protein
VKRLLALAALAALAAGGTACDLSPPAATAEGATVSTSQLMDQLSAVAGNNAYVQCTLAAQGVNLPQSVAGAGGDTVSSAFAAYELSTLVLERLVQADLSRRGRSVSAADMAAARADLASQISSAEQSGSCGASATGAQVVDRLPAVFRQEQVGFFAAQERLAEVVGHIDVGTTALHAYYEGHPTQFQQLCLSDIAVQSQAQAQQIHDAVASGATPFAAEAQQSSVDQQTASAGGRLGCVARSTIANQVILGALAPLQVGQITEPFQEPSSSGGSIWLVLRLDGLQTVPFSQAEPQIRQQLLSAKNAVVSAEFGRITRTAEVTVDPRFGTWSPAAGVQAPKAPPAKDLLSRTADTTAG